MGLRVFVSQSQSSYVLKSAVGNLENVKFDLMSLEEGRSRRLGNTKQVLPAHRTVGILLHPIKNAFLVEDVKATEFKELLT